MGITKFGVDLLDRYIREYKPESVLELGSQNLYVDGSDKPPFASEYYKSKGFKDYVAIDLAGDNGALQLDLSHYVEIPRLESRRFDMVTDFGTSEHVVQMEEYEKISFHEGHISSIYPKGVKSIIDGYYECWRTKYDYCKNDGIIISINPKTGNWINHGYTYLTVEFYKKFAQLTQCAILELHEQAASSNFVDGWEIVCVLRKKRKAFLSLEEFKTLPIYFK